MSVPRPVAFYAPLKSPGHPSPSGDRTMARLLMKALARAGFAPHLASELRSLDRAGDLQVQDAVRRRSADAASLLIGRYRSLPEAERPCAWFTYHVYYKAPDWIGPQVADALGIPYMVAEGSRAPKRAGGLWSLGHEGAEAALVRADAIFVMTAHDRVSLETARPPHQKLIDLPPFLDAGEWPEFTAARRHDDDDGEPRLITVAMMRQGDKLASYRILAEAAARLPLGLPWSLHVVGDGGARGEVEGLFEPLGERVRFHGQVESRAGLKALYEEADLLVWPAVNEAYGMALLEAQMFGCPVVAGAYGGVASVVKHGETGLLTPPGDAAAFAEAVLTLLEDPERRQGLGLAARRFVAEERGLDGAALRLRNALAPLMVKTGA